MSNLQSLLIDANTVSTARLVCVLFSPVSMEERGLSLAHATIMCWVHQYGPELDKRILRHLKQANDSWRVNEPYIKVKRQWVCISYR